MMDKTYILENAVLEQYVLGELTLSEQEQVQQSLRQYPELQELLSEMESSFEKLATENAVDVPECVKINLLSEITKGKIKTIPVDSKESKPSYLWIAASIVVLLSIGSFYLFTELNSLKEEFKVVSEDNKILNNRIEELNASIEETSNWYEIINNPETSKYVLNGNASMPNATVISYVNDVKKSVVVNTIELPELDADHDYQMWADVEGVMIDMGVIDTGKDMLAMSYIDKAESLNITIEKKGGSDHPDVSRLVTNIYLK
jgi:anti-sigma-K factor RskA